MIKVYSYGLIHCSVCVPKGLTKQQIEDAVNSTHPTGISSRWEVSNDATFKTGQSNPCICEQDSERLHYLMVC